MQFGEIWPDSIILMANFHVFRPGEIFRHTQVQSRFFVWCKSGAGVLEINHQKYDFTAGDYFFLPWCHQINYFASMEQPFVINCIHLIPYYPPGRKVDFCVFHSHYAKSEEYRIRKNVPLENFERIVHGKLSSANPLILLSEYIIARFLQVPKREDLMRQLAQLFIFEFIMQSNRYSSNLRPKKADELPFPLQQMLNAIEVLLEEPIEYTHLQYYSKKSIPTIHRLFREHLNTTPRDWINQRRILHAADLMLNSDLSLSEIAARICIKDKFYFSRLFKKYMKITASEFKKKNGVY